MLGLRELFLHLVNFIGVQVLKRREANFKLNVALFGGSNSLATPFSKDVITHSHGLRERLASMEIDPGLLQFSVPVGRIVSSCFLSQLVLSEERPSLILLLLVEGFGLNSQILNHNLSLLVCVLGLHIFRILTSSLNRGLYLWLILDFFKSLSVSLLRV